MSAEAAPRRPESARWVYLLLIVWSALWCGDALWGQSIWFFHDLRHHHLPWRAWATSGWGGWDAPLWAPIGHGFPLLADGQAGILYPPNLVLGRLSRLVFADSRVADCAAMGWSVFLHQALAGCGAAWLARSTGRSVSAALIAGIAYGFSGFLLSHLVYLGMFEVIAWLPWLAGLAIASVREGGHRVWQGGLVVGAVWLAGHPQMALYGCYGAALLAAYEVAERSDRWRAIGRVAAMFALGAGLAGPQLIATAELVRFGEREGGVSTAFADLGALPIEEIANGVFPDLFGRDRPADVPISYHHRGEGYVGRGVSYWEDCFYLGIPLVLLASAAARGGAARKWWTLLTLASMMMLGPLTPVYGLARWLPGMGYLRFPVRAAVLVVLAAGQLAAIGADRLQVAVYLDPGAVVRFARHVTAAVIAGFVGVAITHGALVLGGDFIHDHLAAHLVRADGPDPRDAAAAAARASEILAKVAASTSPLSPTTLWPLIVGLLFAAGYVRSTRSGDPHSGTRLVSGILAIDLLRFGWNYDPTIPVDQATARPAAANVVLGRQGPFRTTTIDRRGPEELDAERMSADLGLWWGAEDVIVPSPLRITRNDAYLAAIGLDLAITGDDPRARFARNRQLADLSGIRFLTAIDPIDLPDLVEAAAVDVPTRSGPRTVRTYENTRAFARAFAVSCARPAGSDPLAALLAVDDLRSTAIVEPDTAAPSLACTPGTPGAVIVASPAPGRDRIDADLDQDALIVLTESWYPGWKVWVDDEPTEIVRADDLFIGIPVRAGHHVIDAAYVPVPVYAAMVLSSLLLGIAGTRAFRTGGPS